MSKQLLTKVFLGLTIAWALLPLPQTRSTLLGFGVGDVDPNRYTNVYEFGWPLPWLTWAHTWTKANGIISTSPEQFNIANFAIHAAAIALPSMALKRNQRSTHS